MRLDVCTRAVAIAAVVWLFTPTPARGQTYTWNQPTTGGDWLSDANWLGGVPNAPGTTVSFGGVATGPDAVTLSAGVTVGVLRFDDVNTRSLTAAYTIGSSGQSITFDNGAAASLLAVSGFTRANQTVAANITIGGSGPLTVDNNGAPGLNTLTLSGSVNAAVAGTGLNVTGWSNTTISGVIGSGVGTLTKSGPGLLVLSGANGYTGGTVVTGGTVSVANDGNLGASGAGVTLDGGALRLTTNNFNTGRPVTLGPGGGTILVTAPGSSTSATIGGVISGPGGLTADGGWYLTLQGDNPYTGPTVINNAGLNLNGPLFGGGNGRLSATSSITINGYVGGQVGILTLDNTGQNHPDRVNDAAPVTLNGGILSFTAGLVGNATETIGDVTVRGFGTLYGGQVPGAGTTGVLTLGTISRTDNFSTLYVGGPVFGPSAPNTSIQVMFTGGISQPPGSGTQIGIIPWIGGDRGGRDSTGAPTGAATGYAETLYTYNDTNGLIALDSRGTTNFVQVTTGAMQANRNIALTGNPGPVNSALSILALVINPNATAGSTITGSSTGVLTVATGAIANIQPLTFDGPALNFGANTGFLYLGSDFTIADGVTVGSAGTSRITGTGGLVVSSDADDGRNTLNLINKTNPNPFTGGLYLNGTARVAFDTADSQLGGPGEVISFRGGGLRYTGSTNATLATGGVNRPLQMTAAGGGAINVEDMTVTLTIPGLVSGPEQLTKLGGGTLVLANPANSYAGGTTVVEGVLAVVAAGSLGTGPLTLGQPGFVGAGLRFDYSGTLAKAVAHLASATLDTNGNTVTLTGVVSGTGTQLTKAGAGTLILSAANTYTGNTVVSGGTLLVTNTTGFGTGYGSVTVSAGAGFGGTGTVSGAVAVTGGKLVVGTPTGPGALTLRGTTTLNSTATFQSVLNGPTAGTGYSQLVVPAGGSLALGGSTLSAALGYTPAGSDRLFLVNNQNPTGGLSGTFAGLPEGGLVTFPGGSTARISYQGDFGSMSLTGGNDVVLYNYQPVPEPGSVLAAAAVVLGVFAPAWGRRRGRHPGTQVADCSGDNSGAGA
jgi:autotransporter-associated beta strand protein